MAGFKVWTTGDLVNASDFNSYLQEQVIMRFANATARDSAVSSAEEGMFCFLADSNHTCTSNIRNSSFNRHNIIWRRRR